MTQVELEKLIEQRRLRDEGMALAESNAGEDWRAQAEAAVRRVAASGAPFTADDVWATGLPRPVSPNAMGALFGRLARAGVIARTGVFVQAKGAKSHASWIAQWRAAS